MRCLSCSETFEAGSGRCPSCGKPIDEIPIGAVIGGRYTIVGAIGSGGMGRVYKAKHATLDKHVAIKILHQKYMGKRDLIKRFKAEAVATSRLNHPNVVSVEDFGEDESGLLYIAMELIDGVSLERIIRTQWPLGDQRILHIVIQILRALQEAHAHGLLHRDLKPENILLVDVQDQFDQVHVLDFGLAKALNEEALGGMSRITAAGSTCGTPEYMSPEQAQGHDLDARSDLYAVGLLMYRMVTGKVPFNDPNPVAVAAKHVTDPIPKMHIMNPNADVHPAIEAAIMKSLTKDRDGRFRDAETMRDHLSVLLAIFESDPHAPSAEVAATIEYRPSAEDREALDFNTTAEAPAIRASFSSGDAWSTVKLPPQARRPAATSVERERNRRQALALLGAGMLAAGAVGWLFLGSGNGGSAQLADANSVLERRGADGSWDALADTTPLSPGDTLRFAGPPGSKITVTLGSDAEVIMVSPSRVSVVSDHGVELQAGDLSITHRGTTSVAATVQIPEVQAVVRVKAGSANVSWAANGLLSVSASAAAAEFDVNEGSVRIEPGKRATYRPGSAPNLLP